MVKIKGDKLTFNISWRKQCVTLEERGKVVKHMRYFAFWFSFKRHMAKYSLCLDFKAQPACHVSQRLTCMDGRDGQKSPGQNRRQESGASHPCENRSRHERQQSV